MTVELVEGSEYVVNVDKDSLPPLTVGLYRVFMAKGKAGFEALVLYMHLLFTYRLQADNVVHADDVYLMKGLQIGEKKLKAAKALLSKMGLIRYRQKRGARGRMGQHLLELVLLPNPGPALRIRDIPGLEPLPPAEEEEQGEPTAEELELEDDQASKKRRGTYQQRFLVLYGGLWKARFQSDAPWTAKRDYPLLARDYKRLGWEGLAAAVRYLFEHPPARMQAFHYGALHVFLPEGEKALAEEARRLRLLKTCSECGRTSDTTGPDCPSCGQPDAFTAAQGVKHAAK